MNKYNRIFNFINIINSSIEYLSNSFNNFLLLILYIKIVFSVVKGLIKNNPPISNFEVK